jgi:D-arginine dehydrogenase
MNRGNSAEVIIVGCGIAGASLAYFLSRRGLTDIVILEREEQPGYHSTGRSAAVLVELDFISSVLQLTILAADFLRNPPEGFSQNPLLKRYGILVMFQGDEWSMIREVAPAFRQMGVSLELLTPSQVVEKIPVVSVDHFDGAVFLPEDGHIDVHELLWSYIRHARHEGVELRCGVEVHGIRVERGRCRGVMTNEGEFSGRWVVNAAGAWAGIIGQLAGATPIELTPYRRTVAAFAAPDGLDVTRWPLVSNYTHKLFFKPESRGLLACPMDEDPVEPCDARPDELVIAHTIDTLETLAPRLVPKSLRQKWAGLRTFAQDQSYIIGEDPSVKGFFWLAGQGGSGIETSPAAGQVAAELLINGRTSLIDANPFSPARFARD